VREDGVELPLHCKPASPRAAHLPSSTPRHESTSESNLKSFDAAAGRCFEGGERFCCQTMDCKTDGLCAINEKCVCCFCIESGMMYKCAQPATCCKGAYTSPSRRPSLLIKVAVSSSS
jgi:hypothetical protein